MSDNKKGQHQNKKGFATQLLSGWGYFQGYTSIFIYVLGSILCFVFGIITIRNARNNTFKVVRVTVTKINGTPIQTPKARKCGSRTCGAYNEYSTNFEVLYVIDGISYTSNLTRTTENYPVQVGDTFKYEYNPNNPQELREFSLLRDETLGILLLIFGFVLLFLAVVTYYCVSHENCRMLLGFLGSPGTQMIY
tara:strand:- start:192 stop:770 length:579 start_codon:yes stop_codon:yes gene_type:complete